MKIDTTPGTDSFVVPAQTLRGSRQEMLATIDQAIMGLLALRHWIAGEAVVMPGTNGKRAALLAGKRVPAAVAQVSRVFSHLMYGHD